MSDVDTTTLAARLDRIESRTAIAELVAGYCEGVDRQNLDLFMSLWHDDASYLIPGGRGDFVGIERIRESQEVIAKAWKQTYHWTTNLVVGFESEDRAVGRSDVYAMCEQHEGLVCLVGGTYNDVFERRAGVWKIAERVVNRWFVSAPTDIPLLSPF
ncbi:nuclear transport factor 2 family protein [Geodermatophilus sabuli]|uniref:Nuclear transport factor 2 family protein n=1 Tax=Geodermatophilus sabuli TaxID=1564158 RepID=A0A7K3VW48_9ACTN|nr:nuclear transport factor 2 family protein [Geodermatophilus sabuli]NEK56871.1 nuclear transport factor 2 family protein [Geodermatophilus sabuli]